MVLGVCVCKCRLYWHPIMKKVHVTTMYITLLLSNTLCGQWLTIKEQIWRRKNVFFVRPLQNNTFIIYEPSLVCYPSIYVKLHKCSPTKQKVKASVWNFYLIKDLNCFPKFLCFLDHNSRFIHNINSNISWLFVDAKALTPVCRLVGLSVTFSDFHCVGISGPLQRVRRPWDEIYFL